MEVINIIKKLFVSFIQGFTTDCWVEITTEVPRCIYYFGPFTTSLEAKAAYPGYIEDLRSEGAQGIKVVVKRCQPDVLTICDEEN